MRDKKFKIILLLCLTIALCISAVLYYIGFGTTPQNGIVRDTSTSTIISTPTSDAKTATNTLVVVPAKDLHVIPTKECRVGGCSGEICSDKEMMSNCIYRPEFVCYKKAKCELQQSGKCGWTETRELNNCVISYSQPL